ncbi:MAG: TolC family protein [Gammaproteobacteria bacterium]|nr:TolC family protein [Gammaproteobacteria bacterium]MBU1978547.1 TolC family protein [Gammaproteobacteria bacterium]
MIFPRIGIALVLMIWLVPHGWSAPAGKRLTLSEAMAAAEAAHPDLRLAEADRAAALAEQEAAASRSDLSVSVEAGLRQARPSSGPDASLSDNSMRLNARKSLYDFGRTALYEQAARSTVDAREAGLLEARERRRIEVMARFFSVLAVDMQFVADNETMAVAYVNVDNARDRLKVGQISTTELAELESRYQDILVRRNASQARARFARAQLANAMNQPGQLAAELEDPKLTANDSTLPDYEALLPIMQENNPRLRTQLALLEASSQRMEALRAESSPTLDAEIEAAGYSRETATRDNLRAGVVLTWPVYQGRRVSAQLAREQAQFHKLQAETDKLRMDLAEALLEVWAEVGQLQRSVRAAARKQVEYRDLALEKARGQYEVELKTNLGDAMAATMEAKLRERRTEYQLALAIARVKALLGQPLESMAKEEGRTK